MYTNNIFQYLYLFNYKVNKILSICYVLNKEDNNKLKYLKIITKNLVRLIIASIVVFAGNISVYFLGVKYISGWF